MIFSLTTVGDLIVWSLLNKNQTTLEPRAQTLISGTVDAREVVDFSLATDHSGSLVVCWLDGAEIHWVEETLILKEQDELQMLEKAIDRLF